MLQDPSIACDPTDDSAGDSIAAGSMSGSPAVNHYGREYLDEAGIGDISAECGQLMEELDPDLPAEGESDVSAADVTCGHCGTTEEWGASLWCPQCGFYPALNRTVETESEEGSSGYVEPQSPSLLELIPPWAWICGGGVLSVIAVSVMVRLTVSPADGNRLWWALGLAIGGFTATAVAQFLSYLFAVTKTDRLGPFDFVMKPVEVWKPTFRALPAGAPRVCTAGWGLTAVVCGLLVVGGIPYSRAFEDWGVRKRADVNLVQEIVQQARQQEADESGSLEDAMNDFTGEAEEAVAEKVVPREEIDCVIFGYTRVGRNSVGRLLLASKVNGRIQFVAAVDFETLPTEVRTDILKQLPELAAKRAFVKSPYPAEWLKPAIMCRLSYTDLQESGRLKEPEFVELLAQAASR